MIYRLTLEQVMAIQRSQTTAALRDRGGLEAILAAPFAGFGDVEFFPSLVEKAAKYLWASAPSRSSLTATSARPC